MVGAKGSRESFKSLLEEKFGKNAAFDGAEVGVFEGMLSAMLLDYFPNLNLFMVDSWSTNEHTDEYRGTHDPVAHMDEARLERAWKLANRATLMYWKRRVILPFVDTKSASFIRPKCLDWVYLDAAHDYRSVLNGAVMWGARVLPGGLLAGDDYCDGREFGCRFGVIEAVNDYARLEQKEVHTRGNLWWIDL